ncbi:tRNA (guanosine(37)-N1)-methyltransferase TrmD [Georgenia yuyongxinii]|uniref:tRNA (guanine-N(1)-)-methyltransferase n=2 Tax=Georgenia yuyongxinii TaxID=2589797 RepID=A0A5B8C158_9MICO|nr:tRNA (guanosine(37)-N1)-methyltransferase TrmD [Georgenia yuyongxinii]
MRIDVLTIFPAYLDALDLSLVGKARRDGLLDLRVHDLRAWTTDRHRTVDDTPFGGGAGMVMRPDIWGKALDDVLATGSVPAPATETPAVGLDHPAPAAAVTLTPAPRQVLLVPTPSGERFTQAMAEDLARADQLVLACGRYEGIDARVAEHYGASSSVEVREVSLGDYVLNGGEVAALVIVEAVARLLPGVLGNPDSLVEESHGAAGLLEYPVYTKPPVWAGLEVPEVLTSGHHGKVARWRRDQALVGTARRRPDMVAALDPHQLDRADRVVLAGQGWFVPAGGRPARVTVRHGRAEDAAALAELAAFTFPLACPPHMAVQDIQAFISEHLTSAHFDAYLADAARYQVLTAESADGVLVGYTLTVLPLSADEPPYADDVAALVTARPAAELSKVYVLPDYQGSGVAGVLLEATAADLAVRVVDGVAPAALWLGTNKANRRAQRSYQRAGFTVVGTRRFRVGDSLEEDLVMVRDLRAGEAAEVGETTGPTSGTR